MEYIQKDLKNLWELEIQDYENNNYSNYYQWLPGEICDDILEFLPNFYQQNKEKFKYYHNELLDNPNLPEDIDIDINRVYDISMLARSRIVNAKILRENEEKFINYASDLYRNPNIMEIIDLIPESYHKWSIISFNEYITPEFIKTNSDKNFNWYYLSKHSALTLELIIENIDKIDWGMLSSNKNINVQFIKENIDKLDFNALSYNESITPDLVLSTLNRDWDFDALSYNRSIPISFIQSHPEFKWSYSNMYRNIIKGEDKEFILRHLDSEINLHELSRNESVNMDFILNWDIEWNYTGLSENVNIAPEFIKSNPDKKWDCRKLASNPIIFK